MIEKQIVKKDEYSDDKRIIGEIIGSNRGPTVIIFAGIHGNEKAGVYASDRVLRKVREENMMFSGNVHFILGNISALNKNVRFKDSDLNRVWTSGNMERIKNNSLIIDSETREQISIYEILKSIVRTEPGPFYFLDLHTTSSPSVPFITISDSLNNRKFSSNFPIPVVLGIEEYLEGPLLTFINDHGYVSLGFEGGQHDDPDSIANCETFIWKALVHSKCIKSDQILGFEKYEMRMSNLCCSYQFFEISFRYELKNGEKFEMRPGFENFERIRKDQILAFSDNKELKSDQSGRIFMPLYQDQGEDGYFILQKVSKFWLQLSKTARKLHIHQFLRLIPGVSQDPENSFILLVNPKIARFLTKDLFHLFGYRQQIYKDDQWHFIKRDRRITELL